MPTEAEGQGYLSNVARVSGMLKASLHFEHIAVVQRYQYMPGKCLTIWGLQAIAV